MFIFLGVSSFEDVFDQITQNIVKINKGGRAKVFIYSSNISESKCHGFDLHTWHCVMSLSKTL